MTFPVEQSAANTTQTANATSWGAQNMPSGIVAGNTLLALVAVDGGNQTVTFTGGWTKLLDGATGSDGTVTLAVAYKKAVGSDTLSLTISSTQQGSCRVIRLNQAEDPDTQAPEVGAVTTGASATPAVGLITPTGGAQDFKFYSVCAHDRNRTFTSAPTDYQANDATLVSGGANGAQLSWGDRDVNAATQDPDNFTYTTSDGFATVVIVVHPLPLGAISAALPIALDVAADLKAQGKLEAGMGAEFSTVADLKAAGALDATLGAVFSIAANLQAASAAQLNVYPMRRTPWTEQPSSYSAIDWNNPITEGLHVFIPGGGVHGTWDIARHKQMIPRADIVEVGSERGQALFNEAAGETVDADSYDIGPSDEIIPSGVGQVTMAGWVRLVDAEEDERRVLSVARNSAGSTLMAIAVAHGNDTFGQGEWAWFDGAVFNAVNFQQDLIPGNDYHHLAWVVDNDKGEVRGYIDGVLDFSNTSTSFDTTTRDPFAAYFLARSNTASKRDNLGGEANTWGLWHRALSEQEVVSLFEDSWQLFEPRREALLIESGVVAGPITAMPAIVFDVIANLKAKGQLDVALAMVFAVTADLKAAGQLDATFAIAFSVAADLKAEGKLDAALAVVFNIVADLTPQLAAVLPIVFSTAAELKAQGKLDAALAMVFATATDLKARGKLDAAPGIEFVTNASLKAVGQLDATLPAVLDIAADLKAKGQLDVAPAIIFDVIANLSDATGGAISAVLAIDFAIAADLKAQGKIDAALAIVFGVIADLTDGTADQISAALSLSFAVVSDLKADGKLDAGLGFVINVAADLKAAGKLDTALGIAASLAADLKATGQLTALLPVTFGMAADLTGGGRLVAALPIVFGIAANLVNSTPGTAVISEIDLIGRKIVLELEGRKIVLELDGRKLDTDLKGLIP